MKEEEWERLTNCEKLRCRICDLDVSESTSNKLAFELVNIEDEIYDKDKEIERLNQYIDFYKDLTERQNKSLERLQNIIEIKTDFIQDLLEIIYFSDDNILHTKAHLIGEVYNDKLKELKEGNKDE